MLRDYIELGHTGEHIASIGLGTWGIGGLAHAAVDSDDTWVKAIREGIEAGMTVIDTAEFYGNGHTEELVGKAISNLERGAVFLISKVWYSHLSADSVIKAANSSLSRLGTSYIDLYLIHWPSQNVPLKETLRAMEQLIDMGKVRYIGVSNFDVELLRDAMTSLSRHEIVANEVKYNILERDVERELLSFCRKESISTVAYTPLAKGSLAENEKLKEIGMRYGKSAAQVALNWLISHKGVMAIPKAVNQIHIKENAGAMGWRLSEGDIMSIDKLFPLPYSGPGED